MIIGLKVMRKYVFPEESGDSTVMYGMIQFPG
jgi:hypothetical protein